MKITTVRVADKIQTDYAYTRVAPSGRDFDPDFKPELTPRQMLELGVFGGKYLNDCQAEFPQEWFKNAKLADNKPDPKLNFFGVRASQPLSVWIAKGWIYPDDPRGWFQWYCRYYMGRRLAAEDTRQIRRWRMITRHIAALKKHCAKSDFSCRPRQRQAVLHWAYDSRLI